MNIKEEKSKEFLKLKKIARELNVFRYSHLGTAKAVEFEKALKILEPMILELEEWLNNATKPPEYYDI